MKCDKIVIQRFIYYIYLYTVKIRIYNRIVNLELSDYPKTYFGRLIKFSHLGDAKSFLQEI